MIEWAKFGYWSNGVGEQLAEFITFDTIESLYTHGYYMIGFNEQMIPITRFQELRCLHERTRSNIFSSFNGLSHSKIQA